jgi:uncharacterized membrane protein (UPF0127 family)
LPLAARPRKGEFMRRWWTAFLLFGLLIAAGPVRPAPLKTLEIVSKTGVHVFAVEIADTPATREKGLMFRKSLPEGQGMLFDFQRERDVAFWMKNTYIPLDIIFISEAKTIVSIAKNTTPLSEALIPSGDGDHPIRRAGAGGAGSDRRNRAQIGHRARRSRGLSDLQAALRPACWLCRRRVCERGTAFEPPMRAGHSAVW